MTPILRAVGAVHVASLLFPARHRRAARDLTDRTARTLAGMRRCAPAKPHRWRRVGPHEYALRMGPVTIDVSRWHSTVTSRTEGADEWGWYAKIGRTQFMCGHHVDKGAPLAQCQADAIAAVERWRDGIR